MLCFTFIFMNSFCHTIVVVVIILIATVAASTWSYTPCVSKILIMMMLAFPNEVVVQSRCVNLLVVFTNFTLYVYYTVLLCINYCSLSVIEYVFDYLGYRVALLLIVYVWKRNSHVSLQGAVCLTVLGAFILLLL